MKIQISHFYDFKNKNSTYAVVVNPYWRILEKTHSKFPEISAFRRKFSGHKTLTDSWKIF